MSNQLPNPEPGLRGATQRANSGAGGEVVSTSPSREEWERRFVAAKEFMSARSHLRRDLIEIAAQHPLIDGEKPNEEFSRRLLLGIDLYHRLRREGREVELYVPGSRHSFEGIADTVSLSEAGRAFLIARGIPAEAIHGDDLNEKFKGDAGVYNSADECFVTASYFIHGEFGGLHTVASPVQLMRKNLHYIWFGVVPLSHTAPTTDAYHNWLFEAFDAVPHVLCVDPSVQDPKSEWSLHSRETRRPKLQ